MSLMHEPFFVTETIKGNYPLLTSLAATVFCVKERSVPNFTPQIAYRQKQLLQTFKSHGLTKGFLLV